MLYSMHKKIAQETAGNVCLSIVAAIPAQIPARIPLPPVSLIPLFFLSLPSLMLARCLVASSTCCTFTSSTTTTMAVVCVGGGRGVEA